MMQMIVDAMKNVSVDNDRAFKSLFVTIALDGSEDALVSDKLYSIIGKDLVQFW